MKPTGSGRISFVMRTSGEEARDEFARDCGREGGREFPVRFLAVLRTCKHTCDSHSCLSSQRQLRVSVLYTHFCCSAVDHGSWARRRRGSVVMILLSRGW